MSATSTSDDPVRMIYDILDGAASSVWTNADPEVHRLQNVSQQERESNNDPALYVWSPTTGALDRFSADNDTLIDDETVEVQVWTLSESKTDDYLSDLIDHLGDYMGDNENNTNFHDIKPAAPSDDRSSHVFRRTDHFIASVQAEIEDVR